MKIPTRPYQLTLLCSLLVLAGFTIYAHRGIEAALNRTTGLFRHTSTGGRMMPAKIAAPPNHIVTTVTSVAALTHELFATEAAFEPLQSGGSYNITPSVIAGGGGGPSAGGNNTITGTVGQGAPGTSSGGSYSVAGGFWQGAAGGVCPAITITPPTLPNGQLTMPYSQPLAQSGGATPITWSISVGVLPGGINLNTSTGLLSGTPTASGTFNFTVKVTDTNGCMGTQAYTLIIGNCPTITVGPASLPATTSFTAYSQQLTATGGASPYFFTISAGALPAGLTMTMGGLLSGAPTVSGSFNFTVRATDSNTCFGEHAYTLTITANAGLMFYPLPAPVRLLETRAGFSGCTNPGVAISAGGTLTVPARTACSGVPANAAAITGNVTVVPSAPGYITLYPSDAAQPTVANSNFGAGEITNNVFTVGLGLADGVLKIFASAQTHVILDVTGYYAPPTPGGLYFHSLPNPVRLLESRPGFSGCIASGAKLIGTGDPNADPNLDLALQGRSPVAVPCNAIPATAQVLVGNATTVLPSGGGYLTIYPSGGARPTVASSNYAGADVINGPFAVKLGADGKFKVYTFATTDLVIDILGYYSADATDANGPGLLFNQIAHPVRLLETRTNPPNLPGCIKPGVRLESQTIYTYVARNDCEGIVFNTAQAIVGNATVVTPDNAGYMTFFPVGQNLPTVATSNFKAGGAYNRHFFVGLNATTGDFAIFFNMGGTQFTTDLVIDVSGYFAP